MKRLKELKITNKLKSIGPKLKWMMFSELQDLKVTSEYIDLICPDGENDNITSTEQIENLVRETLIREFSPKIKEMKSFEFLVDSVVHNLKKKQLEQED